MSHEIETMAYTNEVPWHGLGVKVGNSLSPQKMVEKAGLDWKVEKKRLKTEDGIWVPDRFAIVRDSDKSPLSVCSKSFIPVQNEDAFDFFSKFCKNGKMKMETAGALAGGKRVWGLARMESGDFDVSKNDPVESYLLMANSHAPGKAFTIMFTPIRVVCQNTLNLALRGTAATKVDNIFKQAHKSAFDADAKAAAEIVLGLSEGVMGSFAEQAKYLASRKITDAQVAEYFTSIYQPKLELTKQSDLNEVDFNQTVRKLQEIYIHQPGADLSPGTWWSAFNAVTYFVDHVKGKPGESRLNTAWFGPQGAGKKITALETAIQMSKGSRKA